MGSGSSPAGVAPQLPVRVIAFSFALGFVVSLLAGTLFLQNHGGPACSVTFEDSHHRRCRRPTRSGLCVEDVFDAVDSVYRELWPGSVDLLIRSSAVGRFFLMEMVFESVDHMWPKGVGDVVLVLDQGDRDAVSLVPSWVKVFFEENPLGLPKDLMQQWSYGWADRYTTADFVALLEDDVMFIMKVTPPLLFSLAEGAPYLIGSARNQSNVWLASSEYFVGPGEFAANFMVQQPLVLPRGAFAAFREHVAKRHAGSPDQASYDKAYLWFTQHGGKLSKAYVQNTALGNFMFFHMKEKVHVALEWSGHTPVPRVAAHVPWTKSFLEGSKYALNYPRYSSLYITSAAKYAHEGLCLSLPHGELPGCESVKEGQTQKQVWRYAHDWQDWPLLLYKRDESGTVLYDRHLQVMHCVYNRLARLTARGKVKSWMSTAKGVVEDLKLCLHSGQGAA